MRSLSSRRGITAAWSGSQQAVSGRRCPLSCSAHCPALPTGSGNVWSFSAEDTAHTAPSTWYSGGACGVQCVRAASSGLHPCTSACSAGWRGCGCPGSSRPLGPVSVICPKHNGCIRSVLTLVVCAGSGSGDVREGRGEQQGSRPEALRGGLHTAPRDVGLS